jgi:hypothetical protein
LQIQISDLIVRFVVVLAALAAAVAPVPAAAIERYYSAGVYPVWQKWMTTASNALPVALLDLLILIVALSWLVLAVVDIRRRRSVGALRTAGRILARTAVWSAAIYLVFLVSWGMNYRRVALADKLTFDSNRVSEPNLQALATMAVARLNALHSAAHGAGWANANDVDPVVVSGLEAAQRELGATRAAVPGRPKRTLLDWYFRRAVVDGMTDPIFLETLIVSDLLPFERPVVTAHEWAHLAGYNDEGEANFVAWLACMRGGAPQQYSAWLFLYSEAASQLPREARQAVAQQLQAGPRADLRAIVDRITRNRSARVADAGWQMYNQYLQANRVESGTASYGEVIRLILGTRFNPM